MENIKEILRQIAEEKNATIDPSVFGDEVIDYWGISTFLSFVKSVEWDEPWLIGLGVFHLVLALVALVVLRRKSDGGFVVLFCLIAAMIGSAKYINQMLAQTWPKFARHPYFDAGGAFISVVWSGPLMIVAFILAGVMMWRSFCLMASLGALRMKDKARREKKSSKKKEN
eukprot:TRINITY_DN5212_c0_g1_i1.p1 TRINITY_DN5212_c0_g1~~TRINITY_DN5212_c0_g1_i1.p1  ORF type:complete len:178 (-),score=35.01 TRINITY_DN5212_c0_g1_i1:58-567(-)